MSTFMSWFHLITGRRSDQSRLRRANHGFFLNFPFKPCLFPTSYHLREKKPPENGIKKAGPFDLASGGN
jgi:hypothetical protein